MSSSSPAPIAPIVEPDLRALLDNQRSEIFSSLNCHQWGIVQSFDSAKQTVTVKIAVLRQVPQISAGAAAYVAKPYPLLLDVPIFIQAGGTGALTFPVAAGDICLVLFNDRDFDSFWKSGNIEEPNSGRMHDLSDGLALIGFRTSANPISGYDADRTKLSQGTTFLALKDKIEVANAITSLKVQQQKIIDALTALDAKTGPSAAAAITAAQTEVTNLYQ